MRLNQGFNDLTFTSFLCKSRLSNSILYWITAERLCCITFRRRCDLKKKKKKKKKEKKKIRKMHCPGQDLANRCEYIMPVSEVHPEVTDKAGPAGPEPDQLGFIVSIWLSVPACGPPLDEMQAEGINV